MLHVGKRKLTGFRVELIFVNLNEKGMFLVELAQLNLRTQTP